MIEVQHKNLRHVWSDMKQRCYNPKNISYHHYGGRGISVCDRWLHSSLNFINDMGPRPKGKELDRIDNSLGYSPDNCKWSTRSEQMINTRTRKDNYLGHKNIRLIDGCYVIRFSRNHVYHSPKSCKTLDEAIELRDFIKELLDGS